MTCQNLAEHIPTENDLAAPILVWFLVCRMPEKCYDLWWPQDQRTEKEEPPKITYNIVIFCLNKYNLPCQSFLFQWLLESRSRQARRHRDEHWADMREHGEDCVTDCVDRRTLTAEDTVLLPHLRISIYTHLQCRQSSTSDVINNNPTLSHIISCFPQKIGSPRTSTFSLISDNCATWLPISHEQNKISPNRKWHCKLQSLLCMCISFGELWSTNGEKQDWSFEWSYVFALCGYHSVHHCQGPQS